MNPFVWWYCLLIYCYCCCTLRINTSEISSIVSQFGMVWWSNWAVTIEATHFLLGLPNYAINPKFWCFLTLGSLSARNMWNQYPYWNDVWETWSLNCQSELVLWGYWAELKSAFIGMCMYTKVCQVNQKLFLTKNY